MRALLLSAETPSACAALRGLHRMGFEIALLAEGAFSPAAFSWRASVVERPGVWHPDDLAGRAKQLAPDVVLPVTEADLLRLAPVRADVESAAPVIAPPEDVLQRALDKVAVSARAADLGIAVPEQWVLTGDDAGAAIPEAAYPLVAKPARSRVLRDDGTVWGGTATYVECPRGLSKVRATHEGVDTIVQRPVAGDAMGVSLLLTGAGEPSLVFVHRRVRELRPEGGPSACAVSVEPSEPLVGQAVALARDLGLVGVPAQFEFRIPDGGAPVFLEVNPRPWGTLGLALDCGVNFYGVAARAALGDPLPTPPPAYRAGEQRHYLAFELRRAATILFGGPQPGFPGPWPDKASSAFDWIFLPHLGLVGRPDDPLPALGDALRLITKAFG